MSIGITAHQVFDTDDSVGPRFVFDDDGLTDALL
jgi:hypothetical protein